ncbi:MAG: DUF937 domain-containing protein [Deltaproteobacteria bacterium]|nr:DUF937 domain-containing protein [Deltaproteobacteria bacterium]
MSSILDMLNQQLGADAVQQIRRQLGVDEGTASNAISAALPMLLGGLARNSANQQGADALASALSRDHDGGILDNLMGFLGGNAGSLGAGASILGHIFGGKTDAMSNILSRSTGMNIGSAGSLLSILAPLVMGALGRMQRQQGLDGGGLANVLGGERSRMEQAAPGFGGLTRILDLDGDGSVIDDLPQLAGMLGRFFSR